MGFSDATSRKSTTSSIRAATVIVVAAVVVVGSIPALVFVATTPASAQVSGQVDSCQVIDSSGTYELTQNITNSTDDTCIEITASDVILDGNGHAIDGGGSGTAGVAAGTVSESLTNVTVTNVVASDWSDGIRYRNINDGVISDNVVYSNGLNGIFVTATNAPLSVSERKSKRTAPSRERRAVDPYVVGNSLITNNTAYGNGEGGPNAAGIALQDISQAEVSNNTVTDNNGYGIYLSSFSSDNILTSNTVSNNRIGFELFGSANNALLNNTARNNTVWAVRTSFSSLDLPPNTATDLHLTTATVSFNARDAALTAPSIVVGFASTTAAGASPTADPGNLTDIGRFVNASSAGTYSYLDLKVSYTDESVSGVDESSLRLWGFNLTTGNLNLTKIPKDNGVNTQENYVHANITGFDYGVVAPLGTEQQAEPGEPAIEVSPDSVEFGNVTVGESEMQNVTVTNTGTAPLEISNTFLLSELFSVTAGGAPPTYTIAPGESQEITVEFAPQSTGEKQGALTIQNNATAAISVDLSGTGVEAEPEPEPDISVSPDSLDFGNVTVGENATDTVTVTNDGNATLQVNATDITGTDASAFTVTAGGAPFEVAPNESQTVTVEFTPESVGDKSATLSVESNDTDNATVTVSLAGTGEAAPTPEIAVSPDSLDFGNVTVGENETQNVTVTNTGDAPLEISETDLLASTPPFNVTADGAPPAYTIAPGESQEITVEFAPESTGEKQGTLSIENNATDGGVAVSLSGTGVEVEPEPEPEITVTPESLDFGNVTPNENRTRTVSVSNTGNETLSVTTTDIMGANASTFTVTSGGAPFELEPGATQNVTVQFAPDSTGDKSASLHIESNDSDEATVEIPLSGTAANILTITGADGTINYGFSVTGEVGESGDTVDQQFADDIDGQTASGVAGGGEDSYTFTGDLIRLEVSGDATVLLNGEEIDPGDYPDNILRVSGANGTTNYGFSASRAGVSEVAGSVDQQFADEIGAKTASGVAGGGEDIYGFNGDLVRLDVSDQATVILNGDEIDPGDYPDDILRVSGVDGTVSYEFAATSGVSEAYGVDQQFADSIEGTTASGVAGGGEDAYAFSGGLTRLAVSGQARVVLNGEEIDPGDYPDNIITISGVGETVSYEFTASGDVGENYGVEQQFADRIEGTTGSGVVGPGDDSYTFAGDLRSLNVNGNANVTVNGEEVDESEV